jgi:putative tryptophan/tyrosine transport system substrate-binding protein
MAIGIARRKFIVALGGAAAAWPLDARAQQPAMPVIGFLSSRSAAEAAYLVAAFRQGLSEVGYKEGHNFAIEYRWADGQYDRLPALAADLVKDHVAVIAATGGAASGLAAKSATTAVPIVFTVGDDPVATGLVTSLNRPGGNVTGVGMLSNQLGAKRLELLHELAGNIHVIAFLANPAYPSSEAQLRDVMDAARSLGIKLRILRASNPGEIDAAFASLVDEPADALLLGVDPFYNGRREQLVALAARHALPTIYFYREFVAGGGLMSYAPSLVDGYRQTGVYCGRILRGEKPGDLPVILPTKFEFVINLKTAKTLGVTIPPSLLATADEVIE